MKMQKRSSFRKTIKY